MLKRLIGLAPLAGLFAVLLVAPALAQEGSIRPWQLWYQEARSPVMQQIEDFHILVNWVITAITLFVLGLLIYVAIRFNAKANPTPSKTTHHTTIEVLWTAVPVLILVVIAVPSFKLLYYMDRHENPDMTLKVTGNQWFWSYEYTDSQIAFDSFMVEEADLKEGQPRLLTVDNTVVLPVDTNIQILGTSNDVIHNWAMPQFGVKLDVFPGRVNETWMRITAPGDYYGQCSEICGINHGFMPIHIKAVPKQEYQAWLEQAKEEFATNDSPSPAAPAATEEAPVRVAEAGEAAQ